MAADPIVFNYLKGPGPRGPAATIAVGTVTTGEPETGVEVVNSGTQSVAVFDFTIPQGKSGNKFVTLYKVSETQPATPEGDEPAGWVANILDGINWVSNAWVDTHGTLIDVWSVPIRVTSENTETRYIASDTTPDTPTGNDPAGWSIEIPASGTIWSSTVRKISTGTILGTWSTPSKISLDTYEIRYIVADTAPETPTGNTPEGWSLVLPSSGTIWASAARKLSSGTLVGAWSTPGKISSDYFEVRYKASATVPATPEGTDPAGWTVAMPTTGIIWASVSRKLASGTVSGVWSDPAQVSGPRGYYQATIYIVADTAPATPTGNTPEGWASYPQAGINWASVGVIDQDGALVGLWSAPVRWTGENIIPKGAYSADIQYAVLDVVSYGGSGYICILYPPVGTLPTNATYWNQIVSKGDKGDTGNAATITIGTVTTGAAGSSVQVSNSGDEHDAILNFVIPAGDPLAIHAATEKTTTLVDDDEFAIWDSVAAAFRRFKSSRLVIWIKEVLDTWAIKRTKSPDGATPVYEQDEWATDDGFLRSAGYGTMSVLTTPGALRFTKSSDVDGQGVYKAITGIKGKRVWIKYRTGSSTTTYMELAIGGYTYDRVSLLQKSTDWAVASAIIPADSTKTEAIFVRLAASEPAGTWYEIGAIWIGDYSYLTGSESEEGARILNDLGDTAGVGSFASTILAFTVNPSAGQIVNAGGKPYTFRATTGDLAVDGDVLIGANYNQSMSYLVSAIIRYAGNAYDKSAGSATPWFYCPAVHPLVTAANPGDVSPATITSRIKGLPGNFITTSTTVTGATFTNPAGGSTTLAGGTNDIGAKNATHHGPSTAALANKATLVSTDRFAVADSAAAFATKYSTMANFYTYLKSVADTARTAGEIPKLATGGYLNANGMAFPATQVPSADPNTMDDYEEGNWTPAFLCGSGSITLADTVGRYRKFADSVNIRGGLFAASVSSPSGTLKITGMPFARDNISYLGCPIAIRQGSISLVNMTGYQLSAGVDQNATTISIAKTKDGVLESASVANIFNAVSQGLSVNGMYQTV